MKAKGIMRIISTNERKKKVVIKKSELFVSYLYTFYAQKQQTVFEKPLLQHILINIKFKM